MSALPTAQLIAQQHDARGGIAHVAILAAVAVAALLVIGLNRWWRRRGEAAQQPSSQARRSGSTRSEDRE
jgi:uncharacterized iron-regulated membrane protein